jgi:hypothetical protein
MCYRNSKEKQKTHELRRCDTISTRFFTCERFHIYYDDVTTLLFCFRWTPRLERGVHLPTNFRKVRFLSHQMTSQSSDDYKVHFPKKHQSINYWYFNSLKSLRAAYRLNLEDYKLKIMANGNSST